MTIPYLKHKDRCDQARDLIHQNLTNGNLGFKFHQDYKCWTIRTSKTAAIFHAIWENPDGARATLTVNREGKIHVTGYPEFPHEHEEFGDIEALRFYIKTCRKRLS